MSWLFIIIAASYVFTGDVDRAIVAAILALTFAVLRLRPGWVARMWAEAYARESQSESLFSGSRDDD